MGRTTRALTTKRRMLWREASRRVPAALWPKELKHPSALGATELDEETPQAPKRLSPAATELRYSRG